MRFRMLVISLLLGLVVWPVAGVVLRAQDLVIQDLRIPMSAAGPEGLEAVLVEPAGPGRHPLAIVSHGSPRDARERGGMTARDMLPELVEFARRGFVAVAVLRRGYGTSPGGWAEGYGPCGHPDYAKAGQAGAVDLKTAIAVLTKRPEVDPAKVLAVGVSAGGFATVALTADPPPGLVAAISFAGGRGSSGPDTVCGADALVDAFGTFGARSRIPMLWVYAQNDHFFGPALAQRLFEAFERAGGHASFVTAPAYEADGHRLFSPGGKAIWTPIIDRFLRAQDLGTPNERPIAEAPALPPPRQISLAARRDFQTFLDAPGHKAFAVSAAGAYGWRTARGTVAEATAAAVRQCQDAGHRPCRIYAVDDALAGGT